MRHERVILDERDLGERCFDLVHALGAELDAFLVQGDGIDGLSEANVVKLLTEQNDRLVATQRHLLELVSLLAEFDDLEAGPRLTLLEPAGDSL